MNGNNERLALVSMTNKDVYYVTEAVAKKLMAIIGQSDAPAFFETVDQKSRSQIAIAIKNVSSVVIPEGFKRLDGTGGRHV